MDLTAVDLGLEGPRDKTRVVVAMSGGVDSSVVAGLLKHAGYDVVGITLQLYDHGAAIHKKGACCAGADIHDARRAAEHLGIPHYVLDYEERFRTAVMDRFAASYAMGETPIPCVECNRSVKFADLLEAARELGASALATGHYVTSREMPGGGRALYRGLDPTKDQSYFLFATTRDQLGYVRFPLGEQSKDETRAHARALGLSLADKPDSQDICFVPSGRYADIVAKLRPDALEAGPILHVDGHEIGRHDGIIHFTVGQRRGIGVAGAEPLYVVRIDAKRRAVIVGPRAALGVTNIGVRDVNWIGDGALDAAGVEASVKVRSTRPPVPARLYPAPAGGVRVALAASEHGVAPGQACVFYDSDEAGARVLGGGVITASLEGTIVEQPQETISA